MKRIFLLLAGCVLWNCSIAQTILTLKVNDSKTTLTKQDGNMVSSPATIDFNNVSLNIENDLARRKDLLVSIFTDASDQDTRVDIPESITQQSVSTFTIANGAMNGGKNKLRAQIRISVVNKGTQSVLSTWIINTGLSGQANNVVVPNSQGIANTSLADAPPTGIAYYDANTLNGLSASQVKTILNILSYYKGKDLGIDDLAAAFKDNHFILEYINERLNIANPQGLLSVLGNFSPTSALSSATGKDFQTMLIDAAGRFIANRIKQEVIDEALIKLKQLMDKEAYKDLRTIFPQTYRSLHAIDDVTDNYQMYITTLQVSFQADLNTLPDNLPLIIDNHPDFFDQHPELKATLLTAFYLTKAIRDGEHPGNVLADYDVSMLNSVPNFKAGVKTLQVISASIKDTSGSNGYWVSSDQLTTLIKDTAALKLYMGLVLEEIKKEGIAFVDKGGNNIRLDSVINMLPTDSLQAYKDYIVAFSKKADVVQKKINKLTSNANDSLAVENYYTFYASFIDLFKHIKQVNHLPYLHSIDVTGMVDNCVDATQSVSNIVIDINRRKYNSAIVEVCNVYNIIKPQAQEDSATTSNTARFEATKKYIYKYGTVIAILSDTSSAQIDKALEALIPAASYRTKRTRDFSVTLNAFGGLYTGYEKIEGLDKPYKFQLDKQWNSYGITAPVGIGINFGKRKLLPFERGGGWCYSAFISVLDLGAITAFRYNDTATAQVPTIQFKDILSPGMFLSVGLPKCPLSVNLGAQLGPNLRKVNDGNSTANPYNNYENKVYWRYSISICVDIPVFNFYTTN